MNNFIRARTDDQKKIRMKEIKDAADSLASEMPYSDITLTTISSRLGWSRANLYKYVTTKEEIYLAICEDKMEKYFSLLSSAFPKNNKFSAGAVAEVWAGILDVSRRYLCYNSILTSIIEKNVTVERLADFKKKYFGLSFDFSENLSQMLKIQKDDAYRISLEVLYYASAFASGCVNNPLVKLAIEKINVDLPKFDFFDSLKDFILMEINWRTQKSS